MELNTNKLQAVSTNEMLVTRLIYHRYGHLLYGYITGVVSDKKLAEQYLVDIFKEVPYYLNELNRPDPCTWIRLQTFAKTRLQHSGAFELQQKPVAASVKQVKSNKYLNLMSRDQQMVFCGLYYQHKTIPALVKELGQGEDQIRQLLKEAFRIIRNEQQ